MNKLHIIFVLLVTILFSATSFASANRYQAIWNGKSYLIIDSDNGHLWTFRGNSMIYNGQVDGDEFNPPEVPQIWQLKHGKWKK